jgi:hypothetical protein
MSKSSKERELQPRRAGYQATEPLKLAMGEPNRVVSTTPQVLSGHILTAWFTSRGFT